MQSGEAWVHIRNNSVRCPCLQSVGHTKAEQPSAEQDYKVVSMELFHVIERRLQLAEDKLREVEIEWEEDRYTFHPRGNVPPQLLRKDRP